MTPQLLDTPELLYVGDPMCSWCWGFAPVLEGLRDGLGMPVQVRVGGLRTGPGADMVDDRMAAFLTGCWEQVHAASGQPFDHTILQRRGWRYNTEVPCAAVVAVRRRTPERALAFSSRLHHAFYAEGIDITDEGVYPALAGDFIDPEVLAADLVDAAVQAETRADFAWALQNDVRAFPTLFIAPQGIARTDTPLVMVTQGFRPLEALLPAIRRWMDREGIVIPEAGEQCAIDGEC
ncbi:MAG: putative protein-disulfide isomerase [Myxococcota bacterium]|jgi:putative protein-disulfide isomerase